MNGVQTSSIVRGRLIATVAAAPNLLSPGLETRLRARGLPVVPLAMESWEVPPRRGPGVAILSGESISDEPAGGLLMDALLRAGYQLVVIGTASPEVIERLSEDVDAWLQCPDDETLVTAAIRRSLRISAGRQELEATRRDLERKSEEAHSLYEIGRALSAERNLGKLEGLIIQRCRQLTSADACSLFVLDEDAEKGRFLRFEVTQNDTLGLIHPRSVLPLNGESIAGFVALTGEPQNLPDVYDLPADLPFAFNHSFDDSTGYRSKSMLVVPMRNHDEEIVGVIELINKKQARGKLRTNEITERTVTPFGPEDEEVLNAFASQAAVALDNRLLIDSIEGLFDSFIRASVMAIESRDPATAGHSERVARLTAGIAESVNEIRVGKWKTVYFSSEQLREIRYAGLLHDFGKIGVRENVLIKAKKLYDPELEIIRLRFALALRSLEASHAREQLVHAVQNGGEVPAEALTALNAEFKREASSLSDDLAAVLKANEPSVLEEATAERLAEIALHRYLDIDGNERPLLSERELAALSVRRGSLTGEEYGEVQSHVSQTFRFLSVMPWTRPLRGVPLIAGAHHEKLDGTGYPNRLKADAIPIQSKMMAIADIYDALTAADRPYKLAVPIPKALDILTDECTQGHVDRELLDIFIQRKVYEEPVTPNWPTSALIAS